MDEEKRIFKKNKKGWVTNLIGGILVVFGVVVFGLFLLNSFALEEKAISACEENGLDHRAKLCGVACVEHQCFNETDVYELIMENNKTILHKI